MRTIKFIFISLLLLSSTFMKAQTYKDSKLPTETRVQDLLKRMTIDEKFWQLFMLAEDLKLDKSRYVNGAFGFEGNVSEAEGNIAGQMIKNEGKGNAEESAEVINKIQKHFIEKTRLGIPVIIFDEALHGLVREGATSFPQSIALAASFDTDLMHKVSKAIALETKSRGIRQILSPVINIASDVRWGRVEETYGEDPFLSAKMSVAFVSEFEKLDVITTPKHFIANVGDGGRDSYPIHFNERLLDEIYFPPFKESFQVGGSRSVMSSYNSLDGAPCTANDWLLNKKLRNEWGFKGFTISDAGATGGANVLHYTAKGYVDATENAINNGLDVVFQTDFNHYTLFIDAFKNGKIPVSVIDTAVARVLRAKFELGLFDHPYVDPKEAKKWNGTKEHRQLAKEAALKSIVLLKNDKNTLPLNKNIRKLAVIGIDATEARLGGYSGPGNNKVSILDGIKNKLGNNVSVIYDAGCGRSSNDFVAIAPKYFTHIEKGETKQGLQAEYFNNITLKDKAVVTRTEDKIDVRWTLFSPHPDINYDYFSVRWTGKLKAPKTGTYKIGFDGNDGSRLYINNELIIDNWQKRSYQVITKDYKFEKDKEYDIRVEYYETSGSVWFKLMWTCDLESNKDIKINTAVWHAKVSDAVIVVAGLEEGEGRDRAYLNLPGYQEEMIKSIAATGKPVIVVLVGGSAVTMNKWYDYVPSVVDVWYPGDEGGNAVADVLFGDYNPAGRLPVTFPRTEGQLPLVYNHKPTGRNDDYEDCTGKPFFPFGYGLSYTTFEYSDIIVAKQKFSKTDSTVVKFKVTNTGKMDGDEVVQLYIRDLWSSVARPLTELKGFKRISLKAGETKEVSFTITPDLLLMLNDKMKWVVEPGEFRLMIGASCNDIRLRTIVNVE